MIRIQIEQHMGISMTAALGTVVERTDIKSSIGPFRSLSGHRTMYPEVVIRALGELYDEYNKAFTPLVRVNREWESDYQYCIVDGMPTNWGVQIDMVGLPQCFLDTVVDMPVAVVREALRGKIFEVENSLAGYQLLENICSRKKEDSFFKTRFRAFLDGLRDRFKKSIALLAVTDEKYRSILEVEFGKNEVSDDEVRELSGFDRLFGPIEFRQHVEKRGGQSEYLLYVRSSDPVSKLKKPDSVVDHPLLGDPTMRKIIKAYTLTLNIDAPEMEPARRINDTKWYMPGMGMAFPIYSEADLLRPEFGQYLRAQGVDPQDVELGRTHLRAKPAQGAYGCYGHVSSLTTARFRHELRRNMRQRGAYLVQPEMEIPTIKNTNDGTEYNYIDRNFLAVVGGHPEFLGGFRSFMPVSSAEGQRGRNHGNGATVWSEIV